MRRHGCLTSGQASATFCLRHLVSPGTCQAGVQVNKKEREKAKRERKEARKLAEQPVPIMTEDAQPRDFLNETERQETRDWIAERKARFPTKGNLAKKQEALAAVAQSGAPSPCQPHPRNPPDTAAAALRLSSHARVLAIRVGAGGRLGSNISNFTPQPSCGYTALCRYSCC